MIVQCCVDTFCSPRSIEIEGNDGIQTGAEQIVGGRHLRDYNSEHRWKLPDGTITVLRWPRRSGRTLSHHGVAGNHGNVVCNTNSWPAHDNLAGRVRAVGDSGSWSIDGNWVISALLKILSDSEVIMNLTAWNFIFNFFLGSPFWSLDLHVGGFC